MKIVSVLIKDSPSDRYSGVAGRWLVLLCCFGILTLTCCDNYHSSPKPYGFPRVILPPKAYQDFQAGYCPFTFRLPQYAQVEQDTLFFSEKPKHECWFNLHVPPLGATVHCSYSPIRHRKDFDELIQDAFTLAQKHNIKASFIEELPIHRAEDRVHGILFKMEGATASSCQFFLTDSTRHFLRGALYFQAQSRPDSLQPAIDFMQKDVEVLIATLKWK